MIPHAAYYSKGVAVLKCTVCEIASAEDECFCCGRTTVPGYAYVQPMAWNAPSDPAEWFSNDELPPVREEVNATA